MAEFEVSTRNDIFIYDFQVELENTIYSFSIRYTSRTDRWVMDIPGVIFDIPLVGGNDLFKQFHYLDGVPPGQMQVIDLDGLNRDAQKETLSDRIVLGYEEST